MNSPVLALFKLLIESSLVGDCWIYQGSSVSADGYPYACPGEGKNVRANRLMLEVVTGEIGQTACHHCHQPLCLNPGHLYWGTPKTNAQDMKAASRGVGMFEGGVSHPLAKLSIEDVLAIRRTPKIVGSSKVLCEIYKVSPGTMSEIRNGKSYTAPEYFP